MHGLDVCQEMEYENLGDDDFRLLMELENKEVTKSPEKNPWDYDSWDGYVGYEAYEGDDHQAKEEPEEGGKGSNTKEERKEENVKGRKRRKRKFQRKSKPRTN